VIDLLKSSEMTTVFQDIAQSETTFIRRRPKPSVIHAALEQVSPEVAQVSQPSLITPVQVFEFQ
jgi:hypothetical protein